MPTSTPPLAIACSLSPSEYAQRLRDFRRLFATAQVEAHREPTRLYLVLRDATGREAQTRDLLRREQECCPFFAFEVAVAKGWISIDASVPEGAGECLDDLERLATRAAAGARH